MAVIQSGASTDLATVDATGKSIRVNNRPIISATLGSYQCALRSTTMAAGLSAAAVTWSMRYGGNNLCLVEKVIFDGMGSITAFTPGTVTHRLFFSRAFTASQTGGTGATLTGNNHKLRTSYATTAVADIRIGLTGALTGSSFTSDAQALGGVCGAVGAAPAISLDEGILFDANAVGHPIILANNEGLTLQSTVPATGTWDFGITVKWTEVTSAEWTT